MSFADEMGRLTRNLRDAHEARSAALAELQSRTAEALAGCRRARRSTGEELRQGLSGYLDGLRRDVAGVRADVAAMLSELKGAGEAVADQEREERRLYMERLRREWARRHHGLIDFRSTLRLEQDKARREWVALAARMRASARPSRKAATGVRSSTARRRLVPDDLTAIRGIGPAMEQRLNAAGIKTFHQLARMTPSEVRKVLGERGQIGNVEEWLPQARDLAQRE